MKQLAINFDEVQIAADTDTWTPKDIWSRLNQRYLKHFREDSRVEWKNNSKPNLEDFAAYLSAFSNAPDGGVLIFGIDDDGTITGVKFGNEQVVKLERCHVDYCPGARPEFRRIPVVVDGETSFCLAVYIPYMAKLVETHKDEAWLRFGDQKHKMSAEERSDFKATRGELPFELGIAPATGYPEDFEPEIVQDFCDQFRSLYSQDSWTNDEVLRDRNLLRQDNGVWRPTYAFLILAGKNPRLLISGCRIRVQRFSGTEEGQGDSYSPIKDVYLEGNIVRLLADAQKVISSLIYDVTWLDENGKFITSREYPTYAWQEAIINACAHRAYNFSGTEISVKIFSNRLEVESPGGFVPPVSEKTIYDVRASRNGHLMDALRIIGYVRMVREGTRRIRESMSEYGLPPPTFRQESMHGVVVKVILKNANRGPYSNSDVANFFGETIWQSLSEEELAVATHVYRNKTVQVTEMQRLFGGTWKTNKKRLETLVRKGVVVYENEGLVRSPTAVYRLRPQPGRS